MVPGNIGELLDRLRMWSASGSALVVLCAVSGVYKPDQEQLGVNLRVELTGSNSPYRLVFEDSIPISV